MTGDFSRVGQPLHVIVAPDKFAGTMTAAEASQAIAEGWERIRPQDFLTLLPMADGGEGTLSAISQAVPLKMTSVPVTGPYGTSTNGSWGLLTDGTAVVEAATACGRHLRSPSDSPLSGTTYGVGELVKEASAQTHRVVVAVGGTSTIDGGAGCLEALGASFHGPWGALSTKDGPACLERLARIEFLDAPSLSMTVAADVDAPLLGPRGAVSMFGEQKGLAPEDAQHLERLLSRFADQLEAISSRRDARHVAGSGAGGGIPFALHAGTGASISPGAELVADLIGLRDAMDTASVVITGEGSVDEQTLQGKAPAYLAQEARRLGVAVVVIAGQIADPLRAHFDLCLELGPRGLTNPVAEAREAGTSAAIRFSIAGASSPGAAP